MLGDVAMVMLLNVKDKWSESVEKVISLGMHKYILFLLTYLHILLHTEPSFPRLPIICSAWLFLLNTDFAQHVSIFSIPSQHSRRNAR